VRKLAIRISGGDASVLNVCLDVAVAQVDLRRIRKQRERAAQAVLRDPAAFSRQEDAQFNLIAKRAMGIERGESPQSAAFFNREVLRSYSGVAPVKSSSLLRLRAL
jgi:hypothetical protein